MTNTGTYMRLIIALGFGFAMALRISSRENTESKPISIDDSKQRYTPYLPSCLLIYVAVFSFFYVPLFWGITDSSEFAVDIFMTYLNIFFHISIYYALLMILLPVMRKHIGAKARAMLWVIPNYLYLIAINDAMHTEPLVDINISASFAKSMIFVWLAGFLGILTWKTIEHLSFRRTVLQDAYDVSDSEILNVWNRVVKSAGVRKKDYKLVVSPAVNTPVSIGLWNDTIRVVLPEHKYSEDELELVFTHELVHICREDAWSKLFIVFCIAMCWFNPLIWIAMKKHAEEIEFSCDETVLANAGNDIRRKYANLLLDIAGDERGFTTCLSASAKSLAKRLKEITKPARRSSGAIIVAVTFFILFMTCGLISIQIS